MLSLITWERWVSFRYLETLRVDGHKAKLELERQTTLTYAPRVRIILQLNIKTEYTQQAFEEIPSRRLPLFVSALNRLPPMQ
jgi:hypothetical protein